jgi:arginyl-tRNA synthetase
VDCVDEYKQSRESFQGIDPGLEYPPEPEMGDYALTFAMRAGGRVDREPREIAEELASHLDDELSVISKVDVAGPGFVNVTVSDSALIRRMENVIESGDLHVPDFDQPRKLLVEFVSANPTGPLHVGHGRGAVYGDVLARLLSHHGHDVTREYYVNDAGTQIDRLAESLRLRARERDGEDVTLGEDHYKGEYVSDIVEEHDLKPDMDPEKLADVGKNQILDEIFKVLDRCRVDFDSVVHEADVATEESLEALLEELDDAGLTYREDGALFLRTTEAGDDKDRVVVRANGEPTYFANDLVYHHEKFRRGFDQLIDVWGHDHHGYQERLLGGMEFLGHDRDRLEIELYQLVDLYRDGEPVSMSTRGGEFEPLERLIEEVGVNAVRFNFLTTNHQRPLDFDIEVAVSETEENPVYYVQYAHTRMAGILREADSTSDDESPVESLSPEAHDLLLKALDFPYHSLKAARDREPHQLTYRLRDLATQFHSFYTERRVNDPDNPDVTARRLRVVKFLKQVFAHGLNLLGVDAPDRM